MCGIFGSVVWDRDVADADVAAMPERLHHRGPDECGTYRGDHVSLGCRRLSIVDVGGGSQPFFNEDHSVVAVANGEIFNYPELRARLEPRHVFRSDCDVEVIVHAYEERGIDLVDELDGQFAFALYDMRRERVYLARDHFGICPLYYADVSGGLVFASEIKAILSHSGISPEIDLTGLDQALVLPSVVSPQTMFRGVRSLRPGHYLDIGRDRRREHEYWDLVYPPEDEWRDAEPSGDAVDGGIVAALRDAVRRRLQSDVPIGLYVSGGLDSALVACLAAEVHDPNVTHVLSVGFPSGELDESAYQRLVASNLGYPHRHIEVTVEDVCRELERVVWHSEVPLRESYNVASYMLSQAARRDGMKVVLSGEGSDELFAGYSGYRFDAIRAGLGRDDAPEELAAREAMWGDPSYGYDMDFRSLRDARWRLYSDDLRASLAEFDCTSGRVVDGSRLRGRHAVHKRSYLDVKLRLTDHLLGDHGDRMTMANSVEGRYPFLDLDFVRLAAAIPPAMKLRDMEEKHVLKRAARGIVPEPVITREKFPFTAQSSPYLVREAESFVRDWLSPSAIKRRGVFDPDEVERLCARYRDPAYRTSAPLRTDWLMVVLTFTMLDDVVRRAEYSPSIETACRGG